MFFRSLLGVLLASPFANARQDSIYTSSVSYCAPPDVVLVQQFDVAFFRHNSSVYFDIAAQTTQAVNLSGTITVNAYGMKPVNTSFDLCSLAGAILCPLPQYHFNGSGTIPVPFSFSSKIPSIAYSVPDLEAFAQLTLVDHASNRQVACIQSTLTNGLSTRQTSVGWAVGGFAIAAAVASLLFTINSHSQDDGMYINDDRTPNPAAWRVVDYLTFIQHIVTTGILNLNYPLAYSSFVLNFPWSFGLFRMNQQSNIQTSINNLRILTGSHDSSSAVDPITYANRKESPYNARRGFSIPTVSFATDVTPTVSSGTIIEAGLPSYVNSLGISTTNAYMSVYFSALILIAIVIVVFALGYAIVFALARGKKDTESRVIIFRKRYTFFMLTSSIRVALILFLPITAVAFFQWTLHDAWLPILLSVLLCLWVWAVLVYGVISTVLARRSSTLYEAPTFAKLGALYEAYRTSRWFFTISPIILATLVKAVFIGFVQSSGWAQVIGLLVIEALTLLSLIILKPYLRRGGDVLGITLSLLRLVSTGLLIAFETSVGVKPIPRVVIGFVILVVVSAGVIILSANLLVNVIIVPIISLVRQSRRSGGGDTWTSQPAQNDLRRHFSEKPLPRPLADEDEEASPATQHGRSHSQSHGHSRSFSRSTHSGQGLRSSVVPDGAQLHNSSIPWQGHPSDEDMREQRRSSNPHYIVDPPAPGVPYYPNAYRGQVPDPMPMVQNGALYGSGYDDSDMPWVPRRDSIPPVPPLPQHTQAYVA